MDTEMDKDWIKAVMLLCNIAENNTDSMKAVVRYVELMKREYGLNTTDFYKIYDTWFRTGEIQEGYRQNMNKKKLPLYHRGTDGMCKMLNEGIIDEEMFFETFWEIPYEIVEEQGEYIGFYPSLPGCIGSGESTLKLQKEMQMELKRWIRSAFYMWREMNILEF